MPSRWLSLQHSGIGILPNNKFSSSYSDRPGALACILDIRVELYLVNYDYRSRVYWEAPVVNCIYQQQVQLKLFSDRPGALS